MTSLLPTENLSGRDAEECASLKNLLEICPWEFKTKGKMRLRRTVFSKSGERLQADLQITLMPGHSLDSGKVTSLLRHSSRGYFEYALATSHNKTFVIALKDHEGSNVGEVLATFRSHPQPASLSEAPIRLMPSLDGIVARA
jgi:hypothetical protein